MPGPCKEPTCTKRAIAELAASVAVYRCLHEYAKCLVERAKTAQKPYLVQHLPFFLHPRDQSLKVKGMIVHVLPSKETRRGKLLEGAAEAAAVMSWMGSFWSWSSSREQDFNPGLSQEISQESKSEKTQLLGAVCQKINVHSCSSSTPEHPRRKRLWQNSALLLLPWLCRAV